ncbi:MAG: hypothetical protein ACOYU7_07735, partial [Bacillota bacterium]
FSVVLFIGLAVLSVIPIIGWILSMLGSFYIGCVLAFLFGEAYRKAAAGSSGVFGARPPLSLLAIRFSGFAP